MKRYNIGTESGFNNQRRIKITPADDGEWVRHEDVAGEREQKDECIEQLQKIAKRLWIGDGKVNDYYHFDEWLRQQLTASDKSNG